MKPGSMAARILEELASGPATSNEVAAALPDLAPGNIRAKLNELRGRNRMLRRVRIAAWRYDPVTEKRLAVYALGTARDVPRPRAYSGAEVARRHRERRRATLPANSVFDLGKVLTQTFR